MFHLSERKGLHKKRGWTKSFPYAVPAIYLKSFGYLDDLFVLDGHAGLGLGKLLMYEAVNNTGGQGNSKDWHWFLWTKVSSLPLNRREFLP